MEKDFERLRALRKYFKLSQTEFAERLGVTRSIISNLELGVVEIKDHMFKLIAATFNSNENWLRTGEGDMFVQSAETILDELVKTHNLNEKETAIIEAFLDLSSEGRAAVINYIENVSNKMSSVQTSRNELISGNIAATEKKIQEATAKKEV